MTVHVRHELLIDADKKYNLSLDDIAYLAGAPLAALGLNTGVAAFYGSEIEKMRIAELCSIGRCSTYMQVMAMSPPAFDVLWDTGDSGGIKPHLATRTVAVTNEAYGFN